MFQAGNDAEPAGPFRIVWLDAGQEALSRVPLTVRAKCSLCAKTENQSRFLSRFEKFPITRLRQSSPVNEPLLRLSMRIAPDSLTKIPSALVIPRERRLRIHIQKTQKEKNGESSEPKTTPNPPTRL